MNEAIYFVAFFGIALVAAEIIWYVAYRSGEVKGHRAERAAGFDWANELRDAAEHVYMGEIGYQNPDHPDILALGRVLHPHRAAILDPEEQSHE